MAQFALADELGDFLGRTLEPSDIAQADLLLQLSSAAFQAEAQQAVEFVADDAVSLRGDFGGSLWLPERPVSDVTSITIRHGYGLPVSLALTNIQYAWDRRGLLYRGPFVFGVESNAGVPWGGWGGHTAMVDVTYSHGYEEIPDDIRLVCLQAASRAFVNPRGVLREEVVNTYSVMYGRVDVPGVSLTEHEKAIARRYRPRNV